jgi:hypothetical protein
VDVRRKALALCTLLVFAAGCSVPTQSGPSSIAPSHVPFDLLNPQPSTTTTTQPKPSSLVPVRVFLLSPTQQLDAVQRVVVTPASLTAVINSMLAGPTSSESGSGITSAIPSSVIVRSATTALGTGAVTVDFNQAFSQISGTSAELAVAQVVATVSAQTGLGTGVIFEIDGQRTPVPIKSGASVPGPVYLWQFL